jgi:hypothetical protein
VALENVLVSALLLGGLLAFPSARSDGAHIFAPHGGSGAFTVTVSGPSSLSLGETGTYEAVVSGGSPPYSFHWNERGPVVNTSTSSSLAFTPPRDQIYDLNVSVTDSVANASAGAYLFVSVQGPSPVTVSLHSQSLGPSTVRITADPSGGVAPYRFAWSGPGLYGLWGTNASVTLGNLSVGSYQVSVVAQDARGFNGTNLLTLLISNPSTPAPVSPLVWLGVGLAAGLAATLAVVALRRHRNRLRAAG